MKEQASQANLFAAAAESTQKKDFVRTIDASMTVES